MTVCLSSIFVVLISFLLWLTVHSFAHGVCFCVLVVCLNSRFPAWPPTTHVTPASVLGAHALEYAPHDNVLSVALHVQSDAPASGAGPNRTALAVANVSLAALNPMHQYHLKLPLMGSGQFVPGTDATGQEETQVRDVFFCCGFVRVTCMKCGSLCSGLKFRLFLARQVGWLWATLSFRPLLPVLWDAIQSNPGVPKLTIGLSAIKHCLESEVLLCVYPALDIHAVVRRITLARGQWPILPVASLVRDNSADAFWEVDGPPKGDSMDARLRVSPCFASREFGKLNRTLECYPEEALTTGASVLVVEMYTRTLTDSAAAAGAFFQFYGVGSVPLAPTIGARKDVAVTITALKTLQAATVAPVEGAASSAGRLGDDDDVLGGAADNKPVDVIVSVQTTAHAAWDRCDFPSLVLFSFSLLYPVLCPVSCSATFTRRLEFVHFTWLCVVFSAPLSAVGSDALVEHATRVQLVQAAEAAAAQKALAQQEAAERALKPLSPPVHQTPVVSARTALKNADPIGALVGAHRDPVTGTDGRTLCGYRHVLCHGNTTRNTPHHECTVCLISCMVGAQVRLCP